MSNVSRIKICGITNLDDALVAASLGADALGFIFVPGTPRYIGDPAYAILRKLPPFITTVAVCADFGAAPNANPEDRDFLAVQYYADLDGHALRSGVRHRIRAFRIENAASLDEIEREITAFPPHALQLDAYHPDKLGGAGKTFNWSLAVEAKERFGLPIVLAGGLNADNVADAIDAVHPYAVDVSSGVEAEPGRKDHARLRAFIQAVRKADTVTGRSKERHFIPIGL